MATARGLEWHGDYRPHAHLSARNVGNALLMVLALVPSLWAASLLHTRCEPAAEPAGGGGGGALLGAWCELARLHPARAVNALFFANVTVGFWLVGLLQRSFWLIDPYWTLLPPLIGLFYATHPAAARPLGARALAANALVAVWAVRLTHSYFRREEWKFGQREDWRYTRMQQRTPRLWPLLAFFAVGLAQQPMLLGISLPLHYVAARPAEGCAPRAAWGALETLGVLVCAAGLLLARAADDQLAAFMAANEHRAARGQPRVGLLQTGVWRHSRHPNHCGEAAFWCGLALLALPTCCTRADALWAVAGAAFNTAVLASVTAMVEARMLEAPHRRAAYEEYRRTTSVWLPLPSRAAPKVCTH